MSETKYY